MSSNSNLNIGITATDTARGTLQQLDQKIAGTANNVDAAGTKIISKSQQMSAAFKQNMGSMLASIAGLGAGITSFATSFSTLDKAQTRADAANLALSRSQERLEKLMQNSKATAEQYAHVLKKAGLDDKIEGHRYRKFHLHIYRHRWFTKAINAVPAYVAHAMLGRSQYLAQYLTHSLAERQAFYQKIAKHVSVHTREQDEDEKAKIAAEVLGLPSMSAEQFAQLRGVLLRALETPKSAIFQEIE